MAVVFTIASSSTLALAIFNRSASAISAETRPTLVGREIHMGTGGGHIIMTGVNVWGIETITMDGFGDDQYADRVNIVNTIKSWGANHVRFRLQASDYNNETFMTKAEYLNRIQQWHDLITGAGMYFMPIWWDGHDGPYSGANWSTNYDEAFPMMTDVVNMLGADNPMVFYEPFNEPTGAVNDVDWLNAMRDTVRHFREDIGYTGILLIDPRVWSHCYEGASFTNLENYDAGLAGMNGTHQIIFTKHDYANEYSDPDAGFDSSEWATNNGGCGNWDFTAHAVWESEFGNYNGAPSSVHLPWSQGAASWMRSKVIDSTISGASAFLFGPWLDGNAMTAANNTTKTTWGGYVDDLFLAAYPSINGIGTLGNRIFYDRNRNGIYEPGDGDTGIENVTIAIYQNLDNNCTIDGGETPLLTTTTDNEGAYLYTLLPTDDGNSGNGAGASYLVSVTDNNNALGERTLTDGAANTNNNSQSQPFCAELTATASDIQYVDFGYGDPVVNNPDNGGGSTNTNDTNSDSLADTGAPVELITLVAITMIAIGATAFIARRMPTTFRR